MAKAIKFKTWSDIAVSTSNFKMTTKYTDLGAPDAKKSILGIICNINKGSINTTTSHAFFALRFSYRKSANDNFSTFFTLNNSYQNTSTSSNIEVIHYLNPIIKNIYNFQFKVEGINIKNDFSINDIGIIFRKYKDTNIANLNE